jgi:hypothetical protein
MASHDAITGATHVTSASEGKQEEALLTAKEKKVAKQQKKHVNDAPRFIKS